MKRKLILLGILIWNSSCLLGQSCGTLHPVNSILYPQQNLSLQTQNTSSSLCINVFFHIVRNTIGTSPFTTNNLDSIISHLNQFYNSHNIIMNNLGSDFIDNTDYVNIDSPAEANSLGQFDNLSNAINYYIVNELWDTYDNNGMFLVLLQEQQIVFFQTIW